MEAYSILILLLCLLSTLLFKPSHSKTIVVDGVAEWRNPSVHVGDSIVLKHEHQFNLYIFQDRKALNLCNFTQATLLSNPNSNSSFTWQPSRPGFFYFSFNNDSLKSCEEGEQLAIRVSPTPTENWALAPELPPVAAPSPNSGGVVSSSHRALAPEPELPPVATPSRNSGGVISTSPAYPWPFHSHDQTSSPSPSATIPSVIPDIGGGIGIGNGIPFVSSNPAVPLPTGAADSASIHPLPASGSGGQVLGLLAVQVPIHCMVWLML